jgi:hypothetical protein
MARTRLTVDEIILSVEKHLKQIARRTHSDELILQLIRSKTANQFTEEDIKNLRNKYHKVLELNRLEEVMDTICSIKKVIALILKKTLLILVDMKTLSLRLMKD